MRMLMAGWVVAAVVPALASEVAWRQPSGQGYAFFAPASEQTLHFGVGGEGFVYKGLGIGAELGYAFPAREFRYGVGVLSVNGSYHFNARTHWKISPFITSGYSSAFRAGAEHFVNFGAGINYWLGDRAGLRLEFRDYMEARCACYHFQEFRIGFAFR